MNVTLIAEAARVYTLVFSLCPPVSYRQPPNWLSRIRMNRQWNVLFCFFFFLWFWRIPFHKKSQLQTNWNDRFLLWNYILCFWRGERQSQCFSFSSSRSINCWFLFFVQREGLAYFSCCCFREVNWSIVNTKRKNVPILESSSVSFRKSRFVAIGYILLGNWDAVESFGINSVLEFGNKWLPHGNILIWNLFWRLMTSLKGLSVTV